MRRIGVLIVPSQDDPQSRARVTALQQGLSELGWMVGRNLQIDYRWAVANDERARSAAAELLELTPDVISANSTVPLRAVQQATRTVPIVFTTIIEPIGQGFVASLAHPGGNTTGFSYLEVSIGGKWNGSSQGHCSAAHTCSLHVQSAARPLQCGDLPFRPGGRPKT